MEEQILGKLSGCIRLCAMSKSAWRAKNEQNAMRAMKAFKDLMRRLKRMPAKDTTFHEMILDLVRYSIRQLANLLRSEGRSPQMVALTCRNLLEIDIITRYVLASHANRRDIENDVWIDGKQLFEHLRKWIQYEKPGRRIAQLDATIANFDAKIRAEGISRSKPFDLRVLATKTGMQQQFEVLNKVTSKLVHATALAIWAYKDRGEMRLVLDFMWWCALRYSADTYAQIQLYAKQEKAQANRNS